MKKLKSLFCETFTDFKGVKIHHIDEITAAQFKGRELFNFCEVYAGRAEYEYGKKHRRAAFFKGLFVGLVAFVIYYIFS